MSEEILENKEKLDVTEVTDSNEKHIKNVNVKQCVFTIIISLIMVAVAFIPLTFGNAGYNFAFKSLIGGNAEKQIFADALLTGFNGLFTVFGMKDSPIVLTVVTVMGYATYAYFGILALNIVMALILAVSRSEALRVVFKVISIIAGVLMLVIAVAYLAHFVGCIFATISSMQLGEDFLNSLLSTIDTCGLLFSVGMVIFASIMVKKQFKWFAKLY